MDKVHKTITTQQIDSLYACDRHSKGHQLLPTFKQGSLTPQGFIIDHPSLRAFALSFGSVALYFD
jgi:hypothetical protein